MNKRQINKIYGIYSLLLPILIIGLFFVFFSYGTSQGDVTVKPYGLLSDIITSVVTFIFLPILFITQIVLFVKSYKKNVFMTVLNSLMLLANVLLCVQFVLAVIFLWFLIITFVYEFVYVIIWIVYMICFLINYKKLGVKNEEL